MAVCCPAPAHPPSPSAPLGRPSKSQCPTRPPYPQATEAQALDLLRRGVRCVAVDYRQESIAAGVVAAAQIGRAHV